MKKHYIKIPSKFSRLKAKNFLEHFKYIRLTDYERILGFLTLAGITKQQRFLKHIMTTAGKL